jgi:hypothetical protein
MLVELDTTEFEDTRGVELATTVREDVKFAQKTEVKDVVVEE